jgi:uncharacterized protein
MGADAGGRSAGGHWDGIAGIVCHSAAAGSGHRKDARSHTLALRGNAKLLLLGLLFSWTLAAFGEETVYRGYLMNRVAGLGNNSRTAWLVSLMLVSALFGFSHFGQGITGQIENAIDGLLLGLLYLGCGRNLWVPIIAHGITDTVDITLLFMGKYPGL